MTVMITLTLSAIRGPVKFMHGCSPGLFFDAKTTSSVLGVMCMIEAKVTGKKTQKTTKSISTRFGKKYVLTVLLLPFQLI